MDLLSLWERGRGLRPQGRALLLAQAALPERSRGEIALLAIGARDLAITRLRQSLFGTTVQGSAACERCGEVAEVAFSLDAIDAPAGPEGEQTVAGVRYRLPSTLDLEAASHAETVAEARRILLERCIAGAGEACNQDATSRADAPSGESAALRQMAEQDGRADVKLALECPACGLQFEALFDIARYFWRELELGAGRLLGEVHELACAYGWSEDEILGLSAARRAAYLERVRA